MQSAVSPASPVETVVRMAGQVPVGCRVRGCGFFHHPAHACSPHRVAQELQDRHLEHPRVATTLDLGPSMGVDSPPAVLTEVLPPEDPMDTPVLEDSPLERRADHMGVYLQGAPTASLLQVPMVPSSLDLMDRVVFPRMWILRPTPGSSQWMLITVATSPSRS